MGFDAVRDALRNSPHFTSSHPLPSPTTPTVPSAPLAPFPAAAVAATATSPSAPAHPPAPPRRGSLYMLLNDENSSVPTTHSPSSPTLPFRQPKSAASLSHLLHDSAPVVSSPTVIASSYDTEPRSSLDHPARHYPTPSPILPDTQSPQLSTARFPLPSPQSGKPALPPSPREPFRPEPLPLPALPPPPSNPPTQLLPRAISHSPTSTYRSHSRPSTSESRASAMPPPPVPPHASQSPTPAPAPAAPVDQGPPRSNIPYNPKRRTAPGSVLKPITPAELEIWRHPKHILRQRVPNRELGSVAYDPRFFPQKRKSADDDDDSPRKRRREENDPSGRPELPRRSSMRDTEHIADHYNARPEVGLQHRHNSPIIGLKSFNNWIKSVLIQKFAHVAFQESPSAPVVVPVGRQERGRTVRLQGKVLDLGCGKGGDLQKWQKAAVKEYVGLDIASVSIDQALQRHAQLKGATPTAAFAALDCFSHPIKPALPPHCLPPSGDPFDVVSMQFCMHYAFESEAKARIMLDNVTRYLRPGGIFLGTIPNSELLLSGLEKVASKKSLSFGNEVYTVTFSERYRPGTAPLYGHRYSFFLQDAVDDVPEYVVHWDHFVALAEEYGLQLEYRKEFHHIFEEEHEHPDFAPLLVKMKVVDSNGHSQMDEAQWDAANIYLGFAFSKR